MRNINNCSVCVVGGAGFLGSHLTNHLLDARSCEVLVIDNLISGKKEFVHKSARFEYCDITGSESYLLKLFKTYGIKYVFNMAAEPYIPVSFERPIHVCDVNFMGALKVINAAHEAGCEGILQVSSAEIYGQGGYEGCGIVDETWRGGDKIKEDNLVEPHSSYGAAKAAIDAMVQVRWKEAQVPCIALRQFNCIGERETHPYIVPEIISQLSKSDAASSFTTVRLGNNSFRDFQYAGDAVRMAVELLEKGTFGEVYNMGSQEGVRMYDLAEMIGKIMGFENVTVEQDPKRIRPYEIWHLQSNNTKLYNTITTRPTVTFQEALQRTVADFYSSGNKWCWEK